MAAFPAKARIRYIIAAAAFLLANVPATTAQNYCASEPTDQCTSVGCSCHYLSTRLFHTNRNGEDCLTCSVPGTTTLGPDPSRDSMVKSRAGFVTISLSFHANEVCMGTSDQGTCTAVPFTLNLGFVTGLDHKNVPLGDCVDGYRTSEPFLVPGDSPYIDWCAELSKGYVGGSQCVVDQNVFRSPPRKGLYAST